MKIRKYARVQTPIWLNVYLNSITPDIRSGIRVQRVRDIDTMNYRLNELKTAILLTYHFPGNPPIFWDSSRNGKKHGNNSILQICDFTLRIRLRMLLFFFFPIVEFHFI